MLELTGELSRAGRAASPCGIGRVSQASSFRRLENGHMSRHYVPIVVSFHWASTCVQIALLITLAVILAVLKTCAA